MKIETNLIHELQHKQGNIEIEEKKIIIIIAEPYFTPIESRNGNKITSNFEEIKKFFSYSIRSSSHPATN